LRQLFNGIVSAYTQGLQDKSVDCFLIIYPVRPTTAAIGKAVGATDGFKAVGATDGFKAVGATDGFKAVGATDGFKAVGATDGSKAVGATDGFKAVGATDGSKAVGATDGFKAVGATDGFDVGMFAADKVIIVELEQTPLVKDCVPKFPMQVSVEYSL
jgi:hypothetical protein